jgi:tetratricopeptide (TPR) repeat protein
MLDFGETLTPDNAPTLLNGMPASAIRSELEHILRSRVFVHSHRIRRFLQFVVEECLLGRQHRLKEYLIGMEVFNRLEAFDPRVDSIVRVEARRLRAKLEEFYLTEGREDELRIELRKGSYVPLFEYRRNGSAGYNFGISPTRRKSSIGIGKLAPHNGESPELISEINRRLTHTLINEGCQILAAFDGSAPQDGDGQPAAASRPDYILDGTVEQQEEDVKIWLQLMNVADGTYVWSESGKTADLEVLAQSMNRTVVTSYSDNQRGRLQRRAHSQSFDQYLRGRYLWKVLTPETVRSSVALFQKAVERDPSYAADWAALAEARIFSGLFGLLPAQENAAQIKEAAERAVELNDSLPEAHVARGTALSILQRDWQAGEREFQRAIQLEGRDASAHVAYALQLACRGMLRAANSELDRALELDPAALSTNFVLGWLLSVTQRHDEALAQYRLISQLAPDFPLAYLGLGWAHLGKGEFQDAMAFFSNANSLLKCTSLLSGCMGHCYARLGNHEEAKRLLALLGNASAGSHTAWISMAAICVGLGDSERAFQYLDEAFEAQDVALPLRLLNPEFDSLRNQPRYHELNTRMGLAPA